MGGGDATGVSFNGIRSRAWQGKELNPTFLASHASIYACILEYRLCFAWLPSSLSLSLSQPDRGAKIIESIVRSQPTIRHDNSGGMSSEKENFFFFKGAVRIIRFRYEHCTILEEGRKEKEEKKRRRKKNRQWIGMKKMRVNEGINLDYLIARSAFHPALLIPR